ncbi:Uncharacterized membrane protein YebE, DUF533 family [Devosia enhydra]|uniref:Uncharacterized membrane protein YebE, DUF533 family n=1 Tax=Devosia enhydra TaxID=665118 RepID=A0A1K2HUU5_9HYPH|nr:tellurite resistance TerB family protein [Devosia enhydra]SFZ82312.1 Uncharacterized membrane protein YebE, DUF533 family [Devosia enhydra]
MFNFNDIVKALQTDPNTRKQAMTGAAGLAAGMLLSGGGLGKMVKGGAKLGALAAVGGLAYQAWQKHQQSQAGTSPLPSPREDAFFPAAEPEQEELGKTLVRAMIAAAKADGRIDAEEQQAIFKRLEAMPLSADEKAFVFDQLNAPLDIEAVIRRADTPEHAAEIYAASLVAITADTEAEQAYLANLARRLNLAPGLVAEIHRTAGQQAPAPAPSPWSYTPSPSNV